MKSPFLVLNTAIADRITEQTGRAVFDDTPENEVFPYITMGALTGRDWSDKFTPGQEVQITVHIWSQYAGKKEVLAIGDEVVQAITKQPPLSLAGFNAVVDELDSHNVFMDIDGFTRHAILTFKYLIEEV